MSPPRSGVLRFGGGACAPLGPTRRAQSTSLGRVGAHLGLLLCAAWALTGCNEILGIESATVRRSSMSPLCADDAACLMCADQTDCEEGQICTEGSCHSPELDGGLDGGADASPGMDAGPGTDALPDAASAECVLACEARSRCELKGGVPTCVCAPGYTGEPGSCVDVDECSQESRGGCSPNADCVNLEGTRLCTCKDGFQDQSGDGTQCVSRCASAGCDLNASCSIVAGAAQCQCTGSYSGDGKTCTYNPSCAALGCGANTRCDLKQGSTTTYECKCQDGYEPDPGAGGSACKDIDECRLTPGVCAGTANARCENNAGGFTCPCLDGFRKNALGVCEDIPDCPAGACAGGSCADGVNSYSCSCGAGYTQGPGGTSCVDARNDCPAGACAGGSCVDGVNAYTCTCGAGYQPSADQKSCVEIDECSAKPCKNGGVCSDKLNDFSCDCTGTGYIGKTCDTVSQGCSSGVGTPCTVGVGECANTGTYRCNALGTALECSVVPKAKAAEKCDGKDNDCDGVVDQTFVNTQNLGKSCANGDGECRAQGVIVCTTDGSGVTCNAVPGTPAANDASCNGKDDNCNKLVDEGYVSRVITCGVGECANSVTTSCAGGAEQNTACTPKPASAEICDGKDNDCVSGVDNGFNVGATCSNNLKGECLKSGTIVCSSGGAVCNAPTPSGTTESCNGKDDDCDGTTDDGIANVCQGTGSVIKCVAGTPTPSACGATQTCFTASNGTTDCGGTCRSGEYSCQSGDSWRCNTSGALEQFQVCVPNAPQRCDSDGTRASNPNYGRCVDNSPYVMCADGLKSANNDCPNGTATTAPTRQILAQPFIPAVSGKITRLGLRTATVAAGDNAWLSIHTDLNGQPSTLLNRSLNPVALSSNTTNFGDLQSLTAGSTALTSGVRYWLVAIINNGNPQILLQTSSVAAGAYRKAFIAAGLSLQPSNLSPGATSATSSGTVSLFAEFQR